MRSRLSLIAFVSVLSFASAPVADVIVNEVLANEPGSSVTLEWLELYNNSPNLAQLSLYQLQNGAKSIPLSDTLTGYGYLVICRRLLPSSGSASFEARWGNNSGVWGDDPVLENYPVVEKGISLKNDQDTVGLVVAGQLTSEIGWVLAGKDGFSWERKTPNSSVVGQCIDPAGSTPGRENSLIPLPNDLSVDTVIVASFEGLTQLTFYVRNIGLSAQPVTHYIVTPYDSSDIVLFSDSLPPTDVGFTTAARRSFTLPGMYRHLQVLLPHDDRDYNNRFDFVAPGSEYPPLVLSEFLPNPSFGLSSEWIELKNRSSATVSLADWRISAGSNRHTITHAADSIRPSEYVVIAEDTLVFKSYYASFNGVLLQPPSGWPDLNKTSDSITLIDSFGIEADRFVFKSSYDSNYTWCRGEEPGTTNLWGRSLDIGGSPAEKNSLLFAPSGSGLSVVIDPQVFSPDGDGYDDSVSLTFSASPGKKYTAKIYDRGGRVVRTLFDGQTHLRREYFWDGRTNDQMRLPVGIYILYFEAEGVESLKKTLVVAR